MLSLFFDSLRAYAWLALATFSPGRQSHGRLTPKRLAVMVVFLPVFVLGQLIHWLGFLLDEMLFPGYRKVVIREPLFIVGVPRSGTSHLHRVLAQDPQLTTFRTWECLFALSVTERKFWRAVARLDSLLGQPLRRALDWVQARVFGGLEAVHSMRLDDPEEDYFTLMPILACFILVLPFPFAESVWRMGRFDREVAPRDRQRILDFYASCLQRHLYVHGPDKRLLSKNAAFAPLMGSLWARFPDARVVCCLRDPIETVPSQLSAIQGGMDLFDVDPRGNELRDRFIDQLRFYYENLLDVLGPASDDGRVFLTMDALASDLRATVMGAYEALGMSSTEGFLSALDVADGEARRYCTRHRYGLTQFGLTETMIRERFASTYARYDFASGYRERPQEAMATVGGEVDGLSPARGTYPC